MTKKNWLSLIVLIALAAVYVFFFTDWFKPQTVRIFHTVREAHFRRRGAAAEPVLLFGFNRPVRLTEIKIVPLAEFKKNPAALPVWHLISTSNSVPVRDFAYGRNIRGLKPAVPGTQAEPLETNVVYRLFITAGRIKGQHDFQIGGTPASTTTAANP